MTSARRRKSGFTLIELVVASAIFASVLMMAFTAVAAVNRLQRQVRSQRLFYSTAQNVWQTISQLGRYAQRPTGTLACGYNDTNLVVPTTSLTEAVTVQDSGRRLWLVAPNLSATGSYRVFLFALTNQDANNRYYLQSARFVATTSSCTVDSTAVNLLEAADLRLRALPTDPAPFTLTTGGAAVVGGVPDANALAAADALGQPWRLKINLTFVRGDDVGEPLPVFGGISSRTTQTVIPES